MATTRPHYFDRYPIEVRETGVQATLFSARNPSRYISLIRQSVPAVVAGTERHLSATVVRQVYDYEVHAERRNTLGHDCAVFALACVTREDVREVGFNEAGAWEVRAGVMLPAEPAQTRPGELLMLAPSRETTQGLFLAAHVIVRADVDGESPLFASKLGRHGSAYLSTFDDIQAIYAHQEAYHLTSLEKVPKKNS